MTEPDRLKEWLGGLESSEPLTTGGLRVGARSREVVEENGTRVQMESEVIALEPGALLAVRIANDLFDVETSYRLTSEGEVTRVVLDMTARYKGAARLLAPFLGSAVQEKTRSDLSRLRSILEQSRRSSAE